MDFREVTMRPVEPIEKRETVKMILDEVSCVLIEA